MTSNVKMKLALFLVFATLTVSAQTNSIHNWMLKSGAVITGDYFSSGTQTVVIKSGGTNRLLKISELSTNDWLYYYQCKMKQQQMQLDTEAKQMQQVGTVEFTASLIENFPEKVRGKKGWMDAVFKDFDKYAGRSSEIDLGFDVEDLLGKSYRHCVVCKMLHGPNWPYDQGQNDRPNPLVNEVSNLKLGDKVRFCGSVNDRGPLSDDYTQLFFYIDRIEMIESAAVKKIKEDLENKTEANPKDVDPDTGLPKATSR